MNSTEICVDASLAIKVVVPEAGSDTADALFDQWAGEETRQETSPDETIRKHA
jgi:hypothetical protein